jgi:acetylornithine deacetylase/succinyl-diaminopimelate desuccinylase-like protein
MVSSRKKFLVIGMAVTFGTLAGFPGAALAGDHSAGAVEETLRAKLAHVLDGMKGELTEFCVQLVRCPSVNGTNDEGDVGDLITREAGRLDLLAEVQFKVQNRPSVIVSTSASGPTGLLLVAHMDTVHPGEQRQWSHPPFGGEIVGEKLYGRGAIDNMSGIAAAVYALAALKRVDGALTKGRARLICVPDEESGATGTLGVKHLASLGLVDGLGAIYCYSGRSITVGHRGVVRYDVEVRGKAKHSGMTGYRDHDEPSRSATTGLADLLLRLEKRQLPFSQVRYFDQYRAVINPGTLVSGGSMVSMIPGHAKASIDTRTIPEFERPQMESALREDIDAVCKARPGLEIELKETAYIPPAISPEESAIFSALERATEEVTGQRPPRKVCGPANEGYLLAGLGIPTVCGFGPLGGGAHSVDEHVEIESLPQTALIYALTAHDLSEKLDP